MTDDPKTTILFVDDEEPIREIFSEWFPKKGYRVLTAENGFEALEILKREKPDCCVTDRAMPEMTGTELAEQIRLIDNTIPVLILTGNPQDDSGIIQTLKNGVVDYLTKPISMSELEVVIRSVLRERRTFIDNIFLKKELEKKKQLEVLNRELGKKVDELEILAKIMEEFTSVRKSIDVFSHLVEMALEISRADEARFYLINEAVSDPFEVATAFSERHPSGAMAASHAGGGDKDRISDILKGMVAERKTEPLLIGAGGDEAPDGRNGTDGCDLLAVPLIIRNKIFGALTARISGNGKRFSDKTLYYLDFMNHKAAYAIENLALYENIYENLISALNALVQSIQVRDQYTEEHSLRVTDIAIAIARKMGVNGENIEIMKVAGPLHDVGKIGIRDHILLKPGRLTSEEYEKIKEHPEIGSAIVGHFGLWERERQVIRHHHERYDGGGYPDGLKGKDIPFLARILSVADAYDAMTSDREYRSKMSDEKALTIIAECVGSQFDPDAAAAIRQLHDAKELPGRREK